jgi:hypothetical protein
MTADKFRALALQLPNAIESAHMGHPDFRVDGRIFATLGYPDAGHGMVKLSPEQQRHFMKRAPRVFAPCAGAWGRQGSTSVALTAASIGLARIALELAWRNGTAKRKAAPSALPRRS